MGNYTIQKATINDINEIIMMRKELLKECLNMDAQYNWSNFDVACENYYKEYMMNGRFSSFIAKWNDKIIGYSAMSYYTICPTLKDLDGNMAMLTDLYVEPPYRGNGIGYELVAYIMNSAKEDGYRKVTLSATDSGKYVYEKYGFVQVHGEMTYKFF